MAAHAGWQRGAEVWLSELIWRDFYHQILHHHPHVVGHAFRPEYERIQWEHGKHADELFAAWCEGRTGYPLVDAAMHQINGSGYMHNRLRMVVASFLVKDLGIDWRRGEAYFAEHLNDFDLAANNGGWQWAASTGCDAQPWFRIFNPVTQSEKFDAGGKFIRRYLPQLAALPDKLIHAPWMARPIDLAAAKVETRQGLPGSGGHARSSARTHAAALCGSQESALIEATSAATKQTPRIRLRRAASGAPLRGSAEGAAGVGHINAPRLPARSAPPEQAGLLPSRACRDSGSRPIGPHSRDASAQCVK